MAKTAAWWKGWQRKEIFWWGRQNGSWMPMLTSKNNDNGHLAGFTMSTCTNKCSSMPLQLAGANTAMLSTGAEENHHPNEIWGQNLLPWNSFTPTPTEKTYKTSTGMYTNLRGYPGEAGVRRLLMSASVGKSSIPSRNASGSSGHPHSQRGVEAVAQPMSLSQTHVPSLSLHQSLKLWGVHCTAKQDSYGGMMALVRDAHWTGPGGSSPDRREGGKTELLHQLAMLQQPPPLQ